jgi:hypothetical protein
MAGARMAALVASALFSALSLTLWMTDLWEGRAPRESDVDAFRLSIALTAMIAWLVVVLQGSVSISSEIRNRTLDSLLLTPISGRSIVRGTLAGAVMSASFALAFPLAFAGLAALRGMTSPRAALLTGCVILAAAVFFAAVGLTCSVRFPTGPTGVAVAVALVLALCIGVPAASGQWSGGGWTPAAPASPMTAASQLIADESVWPDNPRTAAAPDEVAPPTWSRVARDVAFWTIAEGLAIALLLAWCGHRIECEYRIRQRRIPTELPAADTRRGGTKWR